MKGGLFLTKAYQPIEESVYPTILEQVRNRLFDFLLNLQNSSSGSEENNGPEAVGRMVNYHIYGDHNVIAPAEIVKHQQVIQVDKGDVASLLSYHRQSGVESDDLQELEDAVSSEPELLPDSKYGPKVGAWLGNMLAKASTGVGKVGLETATKVLPEVLKNFYGS